MGGAVSRRKARPDLGPLKRFTQEYRQGRKYVYFIQCSEGPIKIGTTGALKSRLDGLQGAHPYPLRLLGCLPGGKDLESSLHRRFRDRWIAGEWYSADVKEDVLRLLAKRFRRGAGRVGRVYLTNHRLRWGRPHVRQWRLWRRRQACRGRSGPTSEWLLLAFAFPRVS